MLKVGIIEEVLIPLLKQLESAKDRVLKENDDIEMKNMFEKIKRDIDDIKEVLFDKNIWERDLMYDFGAVSQHVGNIMFDSVTNQTKMKLQTIKEDITIIKENFIGRSELSSSHIIIPSVEKSGSSSHSASEVGESSKTPDLDSTANYARQSTAMAFNEKIMNMLDPQLRHCIFSLSIFPERSAVKKRLLIYWWISLGLVESTRGKTAEEIGEIILMELIKTGLVIPIYREHNTVVDRCRLQSHIRKLVISAAEENQFLSMNPGDTELTFGKNKEEGTLQVFSTMMGQNKVQTLFNIDRKYLKFEEKSPSEMRNMAVMQIGRWPCSEDHHIEAENTKNMAVIQNGRWHCSQDHHIEVENTEFFKGLGTKLKYLSLQGISRITELPDSIGNLTDLIILDLRSCHNLESLTVKLTLLKKLTHLDVSKCYLLDHMPKGLSSLTNLQVLKGFVIGNRRSKDPCRLSDLSRLKKLRKLSINIGRESIITEGDFKKLQDFTALRSLTITWGVHTEKSQNSTPENRETEPPTSLDQRSVPKSLSCFPRAKPQTSLDQGSPGTDSQILLDQLSPPKSLEKLDIRCFPRAEQPKWLVPTALGSLKRLYIRGGKLAQLGNKDKPGNKDSEEEWKVEVLRLRFLKDFDIEWSDLHGVFRKLKCVEYKTCSRLVNFPPTVDGIWRKEKDDHSQSSSTSKNSGASNTSKKDPMIHS